MSDPMKQIWINLQLYFEIYEFSFFRDFFGFLFYLLIFLNFFEFKIDLFNLKLIL